jgi:hypothetical protein
MSGSVSQATEGMALRSCLDGLEAEMEHLAEAWCEARAGGRPTAALDKAWKEADRERTRLERKLRKTCV